MRGGPAAFTHLCLVKVALTLLLDRRRLSLPLREGRHQDEQGEDGEGD